MIEPKNVSRVSVCREVAQIDQFLQETAAREANAKVRLQQFIEELLDRADRAEKQLQIITSCATTPNGSLGHCSLQASKGNGCQVGPSSLTLGCNAELFGPPKTGRINKQKQAA